MNQGRAYTRRARRTRPPRRRAGRQGVPLARLREGLQENRRITARRLRRDDKPQEGPAPDEPGPPALQTQAPQPLPPRRHRRRDARRAQPAGPRLPPRHPSTTLATDITHLKHDGGASAHLSPAGDTQTNEPLSRQLPQSLRMPSAIRTLDGPRNAKPTPAPSSHPDQSTHYTRRAHRDKTARTPPGLIHEPQSRPPRQRPRRIVPRPHESPLRPHQPPDPRPTRPTHQRPHEPLHQPQTTGQTQQTTPPQTIRNTTRDINRPLPRVHITPKISRMRSISTANLGLPFFS